MEVTRGTSHSHSLTPCPFISQKQQHLQMCGTQRRRWEGYFQWEHCKHVLLFIKMTMTLGHQFSALWVIFPNRWQSSLHQPDLFKVCDHTKLQGLVWVPQTLSLPWIPIASPPISIMRCMTPCFLFQVVICRPSLKASKPQQPDPFRPCQAGPWWGPGRAQGLACTSRSLGPSQAKP